MFGSIRQRLPLSYAVIALLATLALGGVLLLTLRSHYLRVERDYLRSNAQAMGVALAQILEEEQSADALQAQVDSLSFLSQTQVRVLDTTGQVVATSDSPAAYRVMVVAPPEETPLIPREALIEQEERLRTLIAILPGLTPSGTITTTARAAQPGAPARLQRQAVLDNLRRTGVLPGDVLGSAGRSYSSQVVRRPILGSAGDVLGYVELSQGPAYAREIVGDVAWGWGIASAVAIVLAAGTGWLVSRRIAAPLLALTEATTSMAEGDLSVRATVKRDDELGTLAHSFNDMADRVQENVAMLRRFVSDASHEIHTPLTALRTYLELAPQDEHVMQARAQVDRLEALTTGLLDLSRLESGTQQCRLVPLSLVPLVGEVSERYASRAEQAGLDFELSLAAEPVQVLGDAQQLGQVLANLLDNAVKFTPDGGTIRLRLGQKGEMAVLSVENTGAGIPEEDLPYLFQRFRRGRNAASVPGSGLGLAVVKAIVEGHGGQVGAENTAEGARFTVMIPLG